MKIYKYKNGRCNISGLKIRQLREKSNMSQEELSAALQLIGLDITQKAISRIETGERVVPDFELLYFSKIWNIPIQYFFQIDVKD
ncbi:MAG: helix-turn-helix transcriptional regulator [Lachnospiraceae bacterium]|nr:helix-turn-helix transcriptional regulator [Lachnospiraceae bacterium]